MDKKSKILLRVMLVLLTLSVMSMFYKVIVLKDYEVFEEEYELDETAI